MRPGMMLAGGAVQGIVATVSNSVDRLSPENIAVTDETGRLLSGSTEEANSVGGASHRMEIQRSVEDYLGQKAERLLTSVSGFGQPRVQISAQLNFDQVERTIESFDPDGQVLQNEGRSETEAPADGSGGGAQTIVNNTYQNSRKLEKIVSGGSGITRLTVAVMLDQNAMARDSTSTVPVEKRIADVQALVKDAIGFDSTRGDRITVTAVPLATMTIDSAPPAPVSRDVMSTVDRFVRPGIGLVAMILLVVLALRTLKAMQSNRGAGGYSDGSHRAIGDAESNLPPLGPPPESVLLKNKVVQETSDRPELMAQVVRAWMAEGSNG
jgi:flagellar M-ring protein FliF